MQAIMLCITNLILPHKDTIVVSTSNNTYKKNLIHLPVKIDSFFCNERACEEKEKKVGFYNSKKSNGLVQIDR